MDQVSCTHFGTQVHLLIGHISSLNILIWGIAQCSHAACKNFASLFACRLILGICEGSIVTGFMIVSSMFYTRRENTTRVGYWCKNYYRLPFTLFPTFNRLNGWNWFESRLITVTLSDTHRHCSSNHLRISQLWYLAHTHYRT